MPKNGKILKLISEKKLFSRVNWILGLLFFSLKFHAVIFTVINTNDSGPGSLRQAIINANGSAGNDVINFNLGAGGPFFINLITALPALTDNAGVTIDGWDNSGNNGTPNTVPVFNTTPGTPMNAVYMIVLGNANNVPTGFIISSSNNLIRGFNLPDFGDGVVGANDVAITISAGSNTILGCYIGMDITGTTKGTRTWAGIYLTGQNNIIGNGTAAGANLISGMNAVGNAIYIPVVTATGNIIRGNMLGLQKDGTTKVVGISQYSSIQMIGAVNNTIGGINAGEGNVISGNSNLGLLVSNSAAPGNVIQGNIVGPQANGLTFVTGNTQTYGISISASAGNTIGGTTVGARNLISGNQSVGLILSLAGSSLNVAQGNYIGMNINGTATVTGAAQPSGIFIQSGASSNTIGGTSAGAGNLISANSQYGINLTSVSAAGNVVQQNTIGAQAGGLLWIAGNTQGSGVYVNGSNNNLIGGSTASARNIISGGSGTGVSIIGAGATGNRVSGNYIGIASNGINRITSATQWTGTYFWNGCSTNTIGGLNPGEGNVMSANGQSGHNTNSSVGPGNYLLGNIIGPQANGVSVVTNNAQFFGININSAGTQIGNGSVAGRNIISGNTSMGIYHALINASLTATRGNYIGPGLNGLPIPGSTQSTGMQLQQEANNNFIGGYLGYPGNVPQANIIAFNTGIGINITSTLATQNLISRNSIYANGGAALPINLNYGANQGNLGKAAPTVITSSTSIVTGSGAATAGVGDTVEVFTGTNVNCRDMMVYVGSTLATAAGNWTLSGLSLSSGQYVSATARTVGNLNTSQASTCAVILPVEMSYFGGECDDEKIKLRWITQSELNTDYFVLERTSNGEHYKQVGIKNAVGNSRERREYTLTDNDIMDGTLIYRLKQIDKDGSSKYYYAPYTYDCLSSPEKIPITIWPNPTDENIELRIPGSKDQKVELQIVDLLGNEVFTREYISNSGVESETLSIQYLAKGMYVLKIQSALRSECIKFLKN